jgi:hypothetical protein
MKQLLAVRNHSKDIPPSVLRHIEQQLKEIDKDENVPPPQVLNMII